jgi:phosphopantetheinyl transferase
MTSTTFVEQWLGRLCAPAGARVCVQPIAFREDHARRVEVARVVLAPPELEHFQCLRSSKRASEYLAGRIAAKRLLRNAPYGLGRSECVISTSVEGAPRLEGRTGIHVSISHSGDFAVAVAAEHRIGIDLEENVERPAALLRYFYGPRERAILDVLDGSERTALINELWCRKEAASKVGRWGGTLSFAQIDGLDARATVADSALGFRSGVIDPFAAALAWEIAPTVPAVECTPESVRSEGVPRDRVACSPSGASHFARQGYGIAGCVPQGPAPLDHFETHEVCRG